jgi:signal transduction histidine kinase/CheY-like chemotaxis protein
MPVLPGIAVRKWLDLPLMAKGILVISIPVLCILFFTISVFILQQQRDGIMARIARAHRAGTGLQGIVTYLVNAESGVRAFLLTGKDSDLQAYRVARGRLPAHMQRLKADLGDRPDQLERLDRIAGMTEERLAGLERLTSAHRGPQLNAALDADRVSMSAIEREIAAVRDAETKLWIAGTREESQIRRRLTFASYGATVFGLLSGGAAMVLFVTGIVRRSQLLTRKAERLARGEVLSDPPVGGDEIGRLGEALVHSSRLLTARESELRKLNEELDQRVRERTAALERETEERQRSESQLLQAQKMDAIGRLAGGIAHDFNNALTIILGYGQLLLSRFDRSSREASEIGEMLQAAEHSAALTRQLLSFSRAQGGVPGVIDVNRVVAGAQSLLARLIGEDVELRVVTSSDELPIQGDESQIKQVIFNLAINARDAMPRGGLLTLRTERVHLDEAFCRQHASCTPGSHAMLVVSDSGTGMSREVRERIFEPFYTTKEQGKGTGLGLSVVYGVVQRFGGSIWVYSQEGQGTTFRIYFPEAAQSMQQPEGAAEVEHAAAHGAATILVVDDEAPVRRLVAEILTQGGYDVLEATGATEAAAASREHDKPIDLLLTDVVMPGTDGVSLARELRQAIPSLRVLLMSGYAGEVLTRRGMLEEDFALLEKPFTAAGLCAKVRQALNGRSAAAAEGATSPGGSSIYSTM